MKKIKKVTLSELAKEMPVIEENEQREYIGGTFVFDYDGSYLGSHGDMDNIVILSRDEWTQFSNNYRMWELSHTHFVSAPGDVCKGADCPSAPKFSGEPAEVVASGMATLRESIVRRFCMDLDVRGVAITNIEMNSDISEFILVPRDSGGMSGSSGSGSGGNGYTLYVPVNGSDGAFSSESSLKWYVSRAQRGY
ncbi:MAG: hypothetical protein LBQ60_20655 [Bacteroidales bacterium]|nr:hypothetical protein [Bacteroidales bacterium]